MSASSAPYATRSSNTPSALPPHTRDATPPTSNTHTTSSFIITPPRRFGGLRPFGVSFLIAGWDEHATKAKESAYLVAQNVMVRMSVSSGFRKYRTQFTQLSRLAAAINNHPESAMMSINRVVESELPGNEHTWQYLTPCSQR